MADVPPKPDLDIFRGPIFPDLVYVGGGCGFLGGIAGFVVGSLLSPFTGIDAEVWGKKTARYGGVFGVALVLLGHAS